jgi:hypothetical protein
MKNQSRHGSFLFCYYNSPQAEQTFMQTFHINFSPPQVFRLNRRFHLRQRLVLTNAVNSIAFALIFLACLHKFILKMNCAN